MKGVILAGGLSSRFGRDKSSAVFSVSSKTVLQLELEVMKALDLSGGIAVSCTPEQAEVLSIRAGSDVEIITDTVSHRIRHPIYGLAACLAACSDSLLVMPCDLPLMRADVLRTLIRARDGELVERDGAASPLLRTLFRHENGRAEPLIAIYETACGPILAKAADEGKMGLFSVLPCESQIFVPCPEEAAFLNMNTPEDFVLAEHRMTRSGPLERT